MASLLELLPEKLNGHTFAMLQEPFTVGVVHQTVSKYAHTLVGPQSHGGIRVKGFVWLNVHDTRCDAREVPQVERVM